MNFDGANSNSLMGLIYSWYDYIRANNIKQSEQLKKQIDEQIDCIEENQTLTIYYLLFHYRYYLIKKEFFEAKTLLHKLETYKEKMSSHQLFYFYFFKGLYCYHRNKFIEALNDFKQANKNLHSITDPFQIAEFHYMIASVYYQMRQTNLSLTHAKQALEMYETDERHYQKRAHCSVLIALNYADVRKLDQANFYYMNALEFSKLSGDRSLETSIYYNLGLLYAEQNESEKALSYLQFALKVEKGNPLYRLKTYFLMSREHFKLNQKIKAIDWLNKGLMLAQKLSNQEYQIKLRLLETLFLEKEESRREKIFLEGIAYFQSEQQWLDLEEYAILFARFYRRNKQFEKAVKYYEFSLQAKEKLMEKEVID
ncbi:hypothetical protein WD019_08565 [Fictibacillus sp. Mic-4]|uniref:response regulator aspartate phosphatase n=1 Tax=Fictibacillus sp. Mic-4 TaxID=3132826 RepID=UPI003CE99D58